LKSISKYRKAPSVLSEGAFCFYLRERENKLASLLEIFEAQTIWPVFTSPHPVKEGLYSSFLAVRCSVECGTWLVHLLDIPGLSLNLSEVVEH